MTSPRTRLTVLSFLMLFVELALIRWTGANVVYLSYFSNFVLLGSFLGIGVGFLRARAQRDFSGWAPVILALLVAFVLIFPVQINRSGSQLIYFGGIGHTGLPTWVTLPVIFLAVALVMAAVAEGVARTFILLPSLEAYRFDIVGSLLGIIAFSVLSFLRAPPVAWGLVVAITFVVLRRVRAVQAVALSILVLMLGAESLMVGQSWSPYYRVNIRPFTEKGATLYAIDVNGIPHQLIETTKRRLATEPIYGTPYVRGSGNPFTDVLIVGAGNGSDVAIALANGAQHVDAVEIDPRIQQIGADLNPDRPYDDPRVTVHIDDGRAFLERTKKRYDLILFALPDSLTLVAGQSSLRLESYLFTKEALTNARDHLKPRGMFAMYNYYRQRWLVDRLAGTLSTVYGHPPCADAVELTGGLAMLTASKDASAVSCDAVWKTATTPVPDAETDDHPFLYLRDRTIPGFYLLTISLILLASLLFVRAAGGPLRGIRPYLDLFAMGAAFLLLETKNVVQFALLFGTTWLVNALVFGGILLSVLAAIEVIRRVQITRRGPLFAALFVALAVAWVVPPGALLGLNLPLRFLGAVALAFAPIFLANLVFAQRFKDTGDSTTAFGANLLGAMVGGVLEYASLVTGYRALLIIVALLYGFAYASGRRATVSA